MVSKMDALDLTIRKNAEESRVPPTHPHPYFITLEQFKTAPTGPTYMKTEPLSPKNTLPPYTSESPKTTIPPYTDNSPPKTTIPTYPKDLPTIHLDTSSSPNTSENAWRQHSPDTTSPHYRTNTPTSPASTGSTPTYIPSSDYHKKAVAPTSSRPFKIYTSNKSVTHYTSHYLYQTPEWFEYRQRMMDQIKGQSPDGYLQTKMRRDNNNGSKSADLKNNNIESDKDAAYWERRRKNNEAAKKSRDARRQKEDEIAIRAGFLEREYVRLQYENRQLIERLARYEPNPALMFAGHVM